MIPGRTPPLALSRLEAERLPTDQNVTHLTQLITARSPADPPHDMEPR